MKTEPPTGDEFDRLIERISANVLSAAENANALLPDPVVVPRRRAKLGIVIITVLVVLGLGTAGTAYALSTAHPFWETPVPATTATPTPSSTPEPQPTITPSPTPTTPSTPTVSISSVTYSPPSWGAGVTAKIAGLAPNTSYTVSIDSRYKGESTTPDGYFSVLSTPANMATDGSGNATITWTPDTFPQNFTDSGESGYLLGSYVRIDPSGGPAPSNSGSGHADPIALSNALSLAFLPVDDVTVSAPACVEPGQLVMGQAGLPVKVSGLLPHEFVELRSVQTGGPNSPTFLGRGYTDGSGSATIVMHGNTADFPVSTSAAIAPGEWRIGWLANDRVTPPAGQFAGTVPLTIGGCPAG
jgi:hypothetical protein